MLVSIKKYLPLLFRIFFLWILLHFVLYTVVTFGFGRSWGIWSVVRLWKELFVLLVLAVGFWKFVQRDTVFALKSYFFSDSVLFYRLVSFGGVLLVSFVSTIIVNHMWWSHRFVSLKYNLFPHVVFLARYSVASFFDNKTLKKTLSFVGIVCVFCLLFALLWYLVISLKPWALRYLGYDPLVYEWAIDHAPPAVYRSEYETGRPRNQFVFERPISWWFYLIAFWPLFFVLYLQKKSFLLLWFPRLLYSLNVFLTFSRAAWWVWIFQTFVLLWITYRKHWKRLMAFALIVTFWLFFLIFLKGTSFFSRAFSDQGHLSFFVQGVQLLMSHPWLGMGGSSVWPWSHQFGVWFNPENQFLQIMIEYGVPGFLCRFLFYWYVLICAYKSYFTLRLSVSHHRIFSESYGVYWVFFALCLWLFGLALEGMVLHSFADRMIIYPLMALLGLVLGFLRASGRMNITV